MLFKQLLAIGASFTLLTGLIHSPVEAQPRPRAIVRVVHTPIPTIPQWISQWVGWVVGGIVLSAVKSKRKTNDDW